MPPPEPAHEYQDAQSRSSGAPCSDSYYHHPDGYDVLTGIARVGLYTAAGAIIGHQFHEKGQGAAIGGGLALLTWPWFGGGCSRLEARPPPARPTTPPGPGRPVHRPPLRPRR